MPEVRFSNQYPYTDFHELNLDWVISQVKYWSERVGKSIQSIELTGTVGLVDTYTINYSDGSTSTFDVTNGNGITSVAKTGTAGLVDTYTITFQDGNTTTFEVHNGTASIDPTLTLQNYAADAKATGDAINEQSADIYSKIGGNRKIGEKNFSFSDQWVDGNSSKYYINIAANTDIIFRFNADVLIMASAGLYVLDDNNTVHNLGTKTPNTDIEINVNYNITCFYLSYVANRLTIDIQYLVYQQYVSTFADKSTVENQIGNSLIVDGSMITWSDNEYIRISDGKTMSSASWSSTPYIFIIGGINYIIALANSSSNVGVVWFDKNSNYISGEALIYDHTYVDEFTVTAPENAAFMRFSTFSIVKTTSYAKIDDSLIAISTENSKAIRNNAIYWQLAMDNVLCIGDSLTSGAYYDGSTFNGASIAQNYPYFLGRILNTTVTNAGVSGINVTDWLTNEYPNYTYTDYNTIIIWLGSNGGLLETLPENPTAGEILAHNNYNSYRQLITNLQAANPNALIVVCLIYFTNYWVDISNDALRSIANDFNLPVVDLSDLNADNYPDLRYVEENRYHLIKCGNIMVASRIADAMADWFSISTKRCEFGLSLRND